MNTKTTKGLDSVDAVVNYSSLFVHILANGLAATLAQVKEQENQLPEDVRLRAMHLLSYAFRSGEVWSQTKDLLLALAPKMQLTEFRNEWSNYLIEGAYHATLNLDYSTAAQLQIFYQQIRKQVTLLDEINPSHDSLQTEQG